MKLPLLIKAGAARKLNRASIMTCTTRYAWSSSTSCLLVLIDVNWFKSRFCFECELIFQIESVFVAWQNFNLDGAFDITLRSITILSPSLLHTLNEQR